MYPFESTGIETALASLLNIWLEDLQESGVDLEEYGRKETELNELTNWCFFCYEFIGDGPYTRRKGLWVVKNLTYGPSPSDWKLEVEWQIVDATEDPKKMPGGWIEEDDSGGDESQVEEDQDSDEVGSEVDEEEEDKISDVVGNEMREGG